MIKDWVFEISSGYDGYRNTKTGEWLYKEDFVKKFNVIQYHIESKTVPAGSYGFKKKHVILDTNNVEVLSFAQEEHAKDFAAALNLGAEFRIKESLEKL